jgi:hypothetical protein
MQAAARMQQAHTTQPHAPLVLHVIPRSTRGFEGAMQMNTHHKIAIQRKFGGRGPVTQERSCFVPLFQRHLLKRAVAQNPRVIDQNIDATKVINRCFNDGIAVLDGMIVRHSNTTSRFDFVNHLHHKSGCFQRVSSRIPHNSWTQTATKRYDTPKPRNASVKRAQNALETRPNTRRRCSYLVRG